MLNPIRYCTGHEGRRIGKSVRIINGQQYCAECEKPLPPGTETIVGRVPG